MDKLEKLLFIFPVMIYYAFESLLVGIFISTVWKYFLSQLFGDLSYIQIVSMYWIIKLLTFNVFNLVASIKNNNNIEETNNNNEIH